jgi:aminopeptidase
MNEETLIEKAHVHLDSILNLVFNHTKKNKAVVVYDEGSPLSRILARAYERCLPDAQFVNFDERIPKEILDILSSLKASDFVALVQSTNFRLDAFRIRVELFKRDIKVLEHPHLTRMSQEEIPHYVNSLEYDFDYYRGVGNSLKTKIDAASFGSVESGGELLIYDCAFEDAKLNVGDYSKIKNVGGQFPLGEVFTEAKDLKALNGRVNIFAFGDMSYRVNVPKTPITLVVKEGQVVDCENSTLDFDQILSTIRADEEVVWVRELGFGLNRAFDKTRLVGDIGAYERMCGIHFSLGAKHGMYGKPGFKRGDGKYHVDVFADTKLFKLNDEVVYENGAWLV